MHINAKSTNSRYSFLSLSVSTVCFISELHHLPSQTWFVVVCALPGISSHLDCLFPQVKEGRASVFLTMYICFILLL